jgi:hypothetical protein
MAEATPWEIVQVNLIEPWRVKTPSGVKTLRCFTAIDPATSVKLLPLPQPPVRARTDARMNPSAQRATQLRSVLARVRCINTETKYYYCPITLLMS